MFDTINYSILEPNLENKLQYQNEDTVFLFHILETLIYLWMPNVVQRFFTT
jgi:hypothetical protein